MKTSAILPERVLTVDVVPVATGDSGRLSLIAVATTLMVLLLTCFSVQGHATDETYIWLNPQADHLEGRVEISLGDLRQYLQLPVPEQFGDASQMLAQKPEPLISYVEANFSLAYADGNPIPYRITGVELLRANSFGHFAQVEFRTETMVVPPEVQISSTLMFEFDRFSRTLLSMDYNHFTGESYPESFFFAIFSPYASTQNVNLAEPQQVRNRLRHFVWEGVRHIWIGLDHVLFLVTLIVVAVMRLEKQDSVVSSGPVPAWVTRYRWVPAENLREALWNVIKIVTVFTIAHSITLSLASLDVISLPPRLVESIIALSVMVVALNNLFPFMAGRQWLVLLLFGLFHGLGFASVMQDVPFRMSRLIEMLVCFNVGVELGQLAIVAVLLPGLFLARRLRFYRSAVVIGGSSVVFLLAGFWLYERAFTG